MTTDSEDIPVILSLSPLKPVDIPPEDAILAAGRELMEASLSWKEGKTHHGVKSFHVAKGPGGTSWHARVSVHTPEEVTFDQLWNKLGKNKAVNEKEFIPDIKKVTLVKTLSPTASIWTMYYVFPPPLSPRVFTVLQVVSLDETSPRTGIVISIPIDLLSPGDEELGKLEEKGVRGRYVSVERVMETDNGKLEWRMATSSTPGGKIPNFVVERSMPGKIAEDVPHLLKWLHGLPEEQRLT